MRQPSELTGWGIRTAAVMAQWMLTRALYKTNSFEEQYAPNLPPSFCWCGMGK